MPYINTYRACKQETHLPHTLLRDNRCYFYLAPPIKTTRPHNSGPISWTRRCIEHSWGIRRHSIRLRSGRKYESDHTNAVMYTKEHRERERRAHYWFSRHMLGTTRPANSSAREGWKLRYALNNEGKYFYRQTRGFNSIVTRHTCTCVAKLKQSGNRL